MELRSPSLVGDDRIGEARFVFDGDYRQVLRLRFSRAGAMVQLSPNAGLDRKTTYGFRCGVLLMVCYNKSMDLTGKTALVTGASGKIGRVLVPMLMREGVRCICHCRRGGEELKRILTPFFVVEGDWAERGGVERVFEEVDKLGTPEILIQLTGTFERAELEAVTEEGMREQIEINLTAPMRVAREFAGRVLRREDQGRPCPWGKIIHFTDIAARRPWAGYSVYCAAKAGLTAFTQSLAKELAPRILVNAVAPGMLEGSPLSPEQREKEIQRIPSGRLGTIAEAAEAAIFLLKNDYMNGHVLTIDGGRSL